jgi:hypothetical protein
MHPRSVVTHDILYFFNLFVPGLFDGHPNKGEKEDSFQNSEGKITKLKNKGKIIIRPLDRGKNTIFPLNFILIILLILISILRLTKIDPQKGVFEIIS